MRLVLLALTVAAGAWLLLRRRRPDEHRVVIGWEDGSELELPAGAPDRERLTRIAGTALR